MADSKKNLSVSGSTNSELLSRNTRAKEPKKPPTVTKSVSKTELSKPKPSSGAKKAGTTPSTVSPAQLSRTSSKCIPATAPQDFASETLVHAPVKQALASTSLKSNSACAIIPTPMKSYDRAKFTLKEANICRVFFSSPFLGLHEERQELCKNYFPQLQSLCRAKGVQFVPVDLRWGITSESVHEGQLLNICLREIDRSDVFVGLLAERYGTHGKENKQLQASFDEAEARYPWLSSTRESSVTEVEFMHGHLAKPGSTPAIFCFRNKVYEEKRDEARKDNSRQGKANHAYPPETKSASGKLKKLKMDVAETSSQCISLYNDYTSPKEGAEFIFQTLHKFLDNVLDNEVDNVMGEEANDQAALTEFEKRHAAFLRQQLGIYMPVWDKYMAELDKALHNQQAHPVVVTGEAGSGKTTLICNWLYRLKNANTDWKIVYHFVGKTEGSTAVLSILQRLCKNIDMLLRHSNNDQSFTDSMAQSEDASIMASNKQPLVQQWHKTLCSLLFLAARRGIKMILVLAGLNHVDELDKTTETLCWLPKTFAPGVKVVVSCSLNATNKISELIDRREFTKLQVDPLDRSAREHLCKEYLKRNGKELTSTQLQTITHSSQTSNPLFLIILLKELCTFGNYKQLDKKIDSLISAVNATELLEKYLERLEKDYNGIEHDQNIVQQVLCGLCLSHHGLSESEIKTIYKLCAHVWSPLYFALETFLVCQSSLLRFSVVHLKDAVKKRYLFNEDNKLTHLEILCTYFESERKELSLLDVDAIKKGQRSADELAWLYRMAGDKKQLVVVLTDPNIFRILNKQSTYELLDYWRFTGESGDEMACAYLAACDRQLQRFSDQKLIAYLDEVAKFLKLGHFLAGQERVLKYCRDTLLSCTHTSLVLDRSIHELPGYQFPENYTGGDGLGHRHPWVFSENMGPKCSQKAFPPVLETSLKHVMESSQHERLYINTSYELACLYVDLQSYQKAMPLHTEVIQYWKRRFDQDAEKPSIADMKNLAVSYHGLGTLLLSVGSLDKAEEYFHQCIDIYKKLPVKTDKSVADCLTNIGNVCFRRNQIEKALDYHKQSHKLYSDVFFGQLVPILGNILTNQALCYKRLNKFEEAYSLYQKSLDIKLNCLGPDHTSVALGYVNLGTLHNSKGDNHEAEKCFREAVRIFEINCLPDHIDNVIMARENLSAILVSQKRHQDAMPHYWKAFDALTSHDLMPICLPQLHNMMCQHFIDNNQLESASKVVMALMSCEEARSESNYLQLAEINSKQPGSKQIAVPYEYSIDYAINKWPASYPLLKYFITNKVIPDDDKDTLLSTLRNYTAHAEHGQKCYSEAGSWCENVNKFSLALSVYECGVQKYVNSQALLTSVLAMLMKSRDEDKKTKVKMYAQKLFTVSSEDWKRQLFAVNTLGVTEEIALAKQLLIKMMSAWESDKDAIKQVSGILNEL